MLEFFEEGKSSIGAHAGALHAGVDFEMDTGGLWGRMGSDQIGFIGGADRKLQIVADEIGNLIFVDRAKDEDGSGDAGVAEKRSFLKTRDAEVIDASVKGRFCHRAEAVAVSVRFDGKTKEARTDLFFDKTDVFLELSEIDLNPRWVGAVHHDQKR